MPARAPRPCPSTGCSTLTNGGPCEKHRKLRQAAADTKTPEERGFYSSARWRAIRKAQIQREPLCRDCLARGIVKAAEVADHIVPRRLGGSDEPDNLQSLCWTDHQRKRAQERGG